MLRSQTVTALVAGAMVLFCGTASAQSITIVPAAPFQPGGVGLLTFPAEGTFTMGAATQISKIFVTLQVKLADNKWYDVQRDKLATYAVTAGSNPEAGTYSITFSDNKSAAFEYRMYANLYKKKLSGAPDPVAVAETIPAVAVP